MSMSIASLFKAGGVFMYPILFLSVCAVGIVIERIIVIGFFSRNIKGLLLYLRTSGNNGHCGILEYNGDIKLLCKDDYLLILKDSMQLKFDKLMRAVELLSGIGGVAPLLGFIGTVSGMIISFQSIASSDKVSVQLVASGISVALITTGFGLIVSAICILSESIIRYIITRHAHNLEESVDIYKKAK